MLCISLLAVDYHPAGLQSSFLYCYNGAQKHERFVGFKNVCSITLISIHVTVDDVNFSDGLECKYKSRASTACELHNYN